MSTYTTGTSDKKKRKALIWWLVGLVGLLGLENFYVGKIKAGLIRLLTGLLWAGVTITSFSESSAVYIPFVCIWLIIGLPNLFKLLLGTFRDNIGNALRE